MTSQPGQTGGQPELQHRYEQVRQRIATAVADREANGASAVARTVGLLAVSKTFPAEDVLALAALGQRDFGENYVAEAVAKMDRCAGLLAESSPPGSHALVWHFIGPIQSNKTRPLAERFDWVHSIDRERIARRLSEQRGANRTPLNVCIQVNISGENTKSGCPPTDVAALAAAVATLPGLHLRGLMAIPEPDADPRNQRAAFAQMRRLFEELRRTVVIPGVLLDTLSIGMSADLESAIAEGSTLVRVGTAIFGGRPRASTEV